MTSITEIHKQCFDYLMEYKNHVDPSLLFMTRQIGRNGRSVDNGYIFYGNDDYLQISFWNSRNWRDKLYNIGFVIKKDGSSYIEMTGRMEDEKIGFLKDLINHLEEWAGSQTLCFDQVVPDKWRAYYKEPSYIENLERFIAIEKAAD